MRLAITLYLVLLGAAAVVAAIFIPFFLLVSQLPIKYGVTIIFLGGPAIAVGLAMAAGKLLEKYRGIGSLPDEDAGK